MRRNLFLLIFFIGISSQAWAGSSPSAEKRAKVITKWMKHRLELSSEQLPLVADLNLECEREIDKVTSQKEGFPCMKAVRNAILKKDKVLQKLISVYQFQAYLKGKCDLKDEIKRCIGLKL